MDEAAAISSERRKSFRRISGVSFGTGFAKKDGLLLGLELSTMLSIVEGHSDLLLKICSNLLLNFVPIRPAVWGVNLSTHLSSVSFAS